MLKGPEFVNDTVWPYCTVRKALVAFSFIKDGPSIANSKIRSISGVEKD
jgi:hypothetical protein